MDLFTFIKRPNKKGMGIKMKKVILDVDTGSDDAIAIMTAILSPDLDVLGVCSVNGNRGIDFTTENTLRVVEYIGSDVPVFKGCSLPMVSTLPPWRRPFLPFAGQEHPEENVHQDYLDLPKATIKPQKEHAVTWLIKTLMESDGDIFLIPVGPLTNIAMAMRIEPAICEKIAGFYIMGGGWRENNVTPGAEFNFWVDPEAAKIVIDSGCNITMVPLDATHAAAISTKDADDLMELSSKASVASSDIIEQRRKGYNNWQPMEDQNTVPIHDALAVCAAINSAVLANVKFVHVDIDISGGICDGQSICDVDGKDKKAKPNVNVALSADKILFAQMLKDILKNSLK